MSSDPETALLLKRNMHWLHAPPKGTAQDTLHEDDLCVLSKLLLGLAGLPAAFSAPAPRETADSG